MTRGFAIATAIAGMFATHALAPADAFAQDNKKVACAGINACKGQSDCKGAKHDCKGKNDCKGQGMKYVATEKECTDKGGKVKTGK